MDASTLVDVSLSAEFDVIHLFCTIQISTRRVLCAEYSEKNGSVPEVELLWQVPLRAIRNVELKSMPLILTFDIDPVAAKHAGMNIGALTSTMLLGDEKGGPRREGSAMLQEERLLHKRLYGDWQHDSLPFMRIYNLVKCVVGKIDE